MTLTRFGIQAEIVRKHWQFYPKKFTLNLYSCDPISRMVIVKHPVNVHNRAMC
jgi:hypothetical protein